MEWFGPSWGAPMNKTCQEADVPDWPCHICGEEFAPRDQGVLTPFVGDPEGRGKAAFHRRCFMENLGLENRPAAPVEDGE